MNELDKFTKSNPFKVPENYFDNFEEQILKKVHSIEKRTDKKLKIRQIKPFLAIAASILVLLSLWFLLPNQFIKKDEAKIEKGTNEEFINSYFESVDAEELIHIISSEEFKNQDFAISAGEDSELLMEHLDESSIIDQI